MYVPGETLLGGKAGWQVAVDRMEAATVGLGVGDWSWVDQISTVMTGWYVGVGG